MRTKLTPPVLAKQWGVSPDKVLNFIRSGELRAIDISSSRGVRPRYLIDVADIEAFENRRTVSAEGPAKSTRRRGRKQARVREFF
ncbi:MAG: helix-turn-helix domain-containing protein [Planctomycetales bacterium]|nr:helix-turn-helix domain-containing protein [Planctomycetales bacterium]